MVRRSLLGSGCLAVIVFVAGCGGPSYPVAVVPPVTQILYTDNEADFVEASATIVRTQAAYVEMWARSGARRAAPPVDFDRDMLVVLAAGRSSPGDSIQIQTAGERGEGFEDFQVVYRLSIGCEELPGASYPLQVVRLRRSDKTPVFDERREPAARCRST